MGLLDNAHRKAGGPVFLLGVGALLPETARSVVGGGNSRETRIQEEEEEEEEEGK